MPGLGAARLALHLTIALLCAVILISVPISSVTVDTDGMIALLVIVAVLSLAMVCCRAFKWTALAMIFESWAVFVAAAFLAIILTFVAASTNRPMIDETLVRWDRALGFDWLTFVKAVDASPDMMVWLQHAYKSMSKQLLLLPIVLVFVNQAPRAYVMLTSFIVLTLAASIIFIWSPSVSPYHYWGLKPGDLTNLDPNWATWVERLREVRDAQTFLFSLEKADGIVTMPSVHAGAAVVCAWATWHVPGLKYVSVVWNFLMSISAIVIGCHYLIDILVGWAMAVFVIYAVLRLCKWYEQQVVDLGATEQAAAAR
ncbi:MAG TPA: phosphatase PAP2 family protein [Beijerinckiaceae bacterium]|jgi:membrane-associated phospholipid phosphatase|nr:phosphatase PAP2 family protein [Beijerinckiaceae bacterium]